MQDSRSSDDWDRAEERRTTTLQRFFAGVTEHAFQSRLGVADPPLVDYVSGMLVRFVHNDAVFGLRGTRGQRLAQVAEMLEEADQRIGAARRRAHRHIGDFTLFWTGVYPEMAKRIKKLGEKDALLDYRDQGRRAYFVASRIPGDDSAPDGDLLERMAEQFELIEYGLGEVRRVWESDQAESGPLLIG